jgi:antitoxin FitA
MNAVKALACSRVIACAPPASLDWPYSRCSFLVTGVTGLRLDMCCTCIYAQNMSRMIQVRNVPDNLHRTLKAQAALAGMSLSDFLLAEIRRVAERPTLAELRERLHRRSRLVASVSAAEAVRRERDSR